MGDWCKEFKKEVDEERFAVFSENFLVMEQYAKENGKDMVLNEYADCTQEEYTAKMSPSPPTVEEVKAPETVAEPEPEPDTEAETQVDEIQEEKAEEITLDEPAIEKAEKPAKISRAQQIAEKKAQAQ